MSDTESSPRGERAIGIDLGGTGTRLVALDGFGDTVAQLVVPTPADLPGDAAVAFLAERVGSLAGPAVVRSLGIGASGPIDAEGVIRNPDTLPAFTGIDLAGPLGAAFAAPVAVDNDAVTAAIGEAAVGAGRPFRSVLMLTLGTGVGVAALVDGEPVRGADGVHPEAGHLSLSGRDAPCYCGRTACLEQVGSRSALQRSASALLSRPSGGPQDIVAVYDRALAGDEAATALFDDYGSGIGDGLLDLLTVHRSACVILGGSAATYYPAFGAALRARLSAVTTYAAAPPMRVSELGDLGGALGAAILGSRRPDRSSWLSLGRAR